MIRPRIYLYGYRLSEIGFTIPTQIKKDVLLSRKPGRPLRTLPVSTTLPFFVWGAALPRPHLNDPDSIFVGCIKRSASGHPTPVPSVIARFAAFVRRVLPTMVSPLVASDVSPRQVYIRDSPHPSAVKLAYAQAFLRLKELGVTRRTRRVDAFVKEESYVEYKAHRLILPRPDEFKVLIGPVISAIEHRVYRNKEFIKKVPVEKRPMYIMEHVYVPGLRIFASDYTGFESQFTRLLMEACELQLFDYMVQDLADGPILSSFFREVVGGWNDIRFNGGQARIHATRMSGEMTTSLFNGFSNLMFMRFVCEELCGCPPIKGVVEGDDGLFCVECPTIVPDGAMFRQLGLTIKLVEHSCISEASFCGIVFDLVDRVNLTDPRKVLCNLGYSSSTYVFSSEKTRLMLLKAKCMSFYVQYPRCPVIEVLTSRLLARMPHIDIKPLLTGCALPFWEREKLRHVLGSFNFTGERSIGTGSRELVARLFDFPVAVQVMVEDEIRRHPGSGPFMSETFLSVVPRVWIDYFDRYSTSVVLDEQPMMADPGFKVRIDTIIASRSCKRLASRINRDDDRVDSLDFYVPDDPVDELEFS